ncbi:fasciclin domain-containing protein [Marivirga harenae]|uniref:fasciclin domain-containing protein n=1 Tax=Marivirga harenae TaxID=2010992 RepID=UPI0026DF63B7|nr:fasciclin domain-containing protein [Marivirga harenae]WKV11327.1 fasciclin domain-containing protein [Marivirga harenae]|tara:strand:+ start:72417 stop:72905 length:489 start_codon:yes stop_codon:yes gene_type:complete
MKKLLKSIVLSVVVLGLSFSVKAQDKNIVELAVGTESLSTLVTAVKAAGLVETLSGKGPFTVFAPTNKAFEALPSGTLESLLKPENKDQLIAVLTYHVVGAKVMSSSLKEGQKAKTVQGEEVNISLKGGASVNGAKVAMADVEASNGVVHVIDKVILPPSMK